MSQPSFSVSSTESLESGACEKGLGGVGGTGRKEAGLGEEQLEGLAMRQGSRFSVPSTEYLESGACE
jgi:hypothetical protein